MFFPEVDAARDCCRSEGPRAFEIRFFRRTPSSAETQEGPDRRRPGPSSTRTAQEKVAKRWL